MTSPGSQQRQQESKSAHVDVIRARVAAEFAKRRFDFSFSWKRFWNWIGAVVLFSVISAGALGLALGYSYDWATHRIIQNGLVEMNSNLNGLAARVTLNGEVIATRLPVRQINVPPGVYSLRIERDGYLPWEQQIDVTLNQRVRLRGVLLTYASPNPETVTDIAPTDGRFAVQPPSSLEVRAGNELWLADELLARFSADLKNPRWYSGRNGVVVQAGEELLYINRDFRRTQTLFTLPSATSRYFFEQGGRVLVYTELLSDGQIIVRRVELFENTTLLDRFFAPDQGVSDQPEAAQ